MLTLKNLILLGGIFHLGILLASALTPGVLDWKNELQKLSKLCRQLIWVHGVFIVLVIIGFGVISLAFSNELASGTPLARGVCGFMSAFWLARLAVQFFVFDARPYLKTFWLALGYHGLTVVFVCLVLIYGCATVFGRLPFVE